MRGTGSYRENTAVKVANTNELLLHAKLENKIEKGKPLKLETAENERSLIPADQVKETLFKKGRVIRDAFLGLLDRVASLLITMTEASEVHSLLTKEMKQILEELMHES